RWTAVDPFSEGYFSHSPYNYTLGNPLKFTDPDGMQVEPTVSTNNKGQTVITINVTGKVVNLSNNPLASVGNTARAINKRGKMMSGGVIDVTGLGVKDADGNEVSGEAIINYNFQFEGVSSLDEVAQDDHLIVLADFSKNKIANGVTVGEGGKVMWVEASTTTGPIDYETGYGITVATHELMSHSMMGGHGENPLHVNYGGGVGIFSVGLGDKARKNIVKNAYAGNLNSGPTLVTDGKGFKFPRARSDRGYNVNTVGVKTQEAAMRSRKMQGNKPKH
ncbi:MAG: hypothetical protein H6573_22835, partial [Lewinellaceae bacterium]|nr:hypothetical protein [Lewinellaceae bacterium]